MSHTNKINIVNLHPCIQGEGKNQGVPMILIRFSGCNLNCMFKESICDSSETSWLHDNNTNNMFSIEDVKQMFLKHPQIKTAMITGGQPTIHKNNLTDLCIMLKTMGIRVEIEDNGTTFFDGVEDYVDFASISPKMSNSTPNPNVYLDILKRKVTDKDRTRHEKNRINKQSFQKWITKSKDFQFKFVVSSDEDLEEIMLFINENNVPLHKVYFMPEGSTKEQLQNKRLWIYEKCIEMGVNYSDRLHIIMYNDKKNV